MSRSYGWAHWFFDHERQHTFTVVELQNSSCPQKKEWLWFASLLAINRTRCSGERNTDLVPSHYGLQRGQRTKLLPIPTTANSWHSTSVAFPRVDLGSWEIRVLQGIRCMPPELRGGRKRSLRSFASTVENLYLTTLGFGCIGSQTSSKVQYHQYKQKAGATPGSSPSSSSPGPASSFSYNCLFAEGHTYCSFIETKSMLKGNTSAAGFTNCPLWSRVRTVWLPCKGLTVSNMALHQQWKPLLSEQPKEQYKHGILYNHGSGHDTNLCRLQGTSSQEPAGKKKKR